MPIREKISKIRGLYPIGANVTLGLDIGIASCGWALLGFNDKQILGAGSWCFEIPEVAKTRESKAAVRRGARGQRRRLRRKRQRMRDIRKLLHQNNLLNSALPYEDKKGKPKPAYDPWKLRARGLDHLLSGEEFSVVLIHIAKHRGYRSNSKSEKSGNAPEEDRKVLAGIEAIREKSARYRTIGEMFALDKKFIDRKRNRSGDYSHTIARSLQEYEVRELFRLQRSFGNKNASEGLEKKYADSAFNQLPLQGSENMLGKCPFEPNEYRASSQGYSFEKFRFLTKLINSRIDDGSDNGRRLTKQELSHSIGGFGKSSAKISWKSLIRLLGLPKSTVFVGVGDKGRVNDLARNSKGSAFGSNSLYKVLGEAAWNNLVRTPKILDDIIHILTFLEDVDHIKSRLEQLKLEPVIFDAIIEKMKEGAFAGFAKAGHISSKAARHIIPGLLDVKTYDRACELAGYDHANENIADLDTITNPVAKRAIVETLKQVNALVRHFGFRPDQIHIELGRDVGKGPEERGRIDKGIKDRTSEREKAKTEFCEMHNLQSCSKGELQRFELWNEQKHECMYCYPRATISPDDLRDSKNACQIEHILPRSRSHDNSWHNKVLACTDCNQRKQNDTPHEWFGTDEPRWDELEFRVKALYGQKLIKGFKIRNLLIKNYKEREQSFIERNINDMRFASRVVQNELRHLFTDQEMKGTRRIFARPGAITATLRHLWGLDRLKFLVGEDGKRQRVEDERHHAVDAMIIAACSESLLQRLTKAMKNDRLIYRVDPPWPDYCAQVFVARDNAAVARSENRRARGAGHQATMRKIREENGLRIIYERVAVGAVTLAKLEQIKDPDRNRDCIDSIKKWIDEGKPQDLPPRRNNGHLIKKVTLRAEKNPVTERSGFEVKDGQVDNADMVRLDVFEKDKKFYLVPIYTHQVANRQQWPAPPDLAITQGKSETNWVQIDESYQFRFSLFPFSWVEAVSSKGEVFEGYYRGTDRSTQKIKISGEFSRSINNQKGFGSKTLHSFKKIQIDRLGRKTEIKSEKRTWHGVACT